MHTKERDVKTEDDYLQVREASGEINLDNQATSEYCLSHQSMGFVMAALAN